LKSFLFRDRLVCTISVGAQRVDYPRLHHNSIVKIEDRGVSFAEKIAALAKKHGALEYADRIADGVRKRLTRRLSSSTSHHEL
jgi:hypothetical protein